MAVAVEEFDESRRPALVSIRAVIYVERDSQKAIIIGKQGRMLKTLGAEARAEIEALLGAHVFLDLWVKVWKNWRKDPRALRTLGYQGIKNESRTPSARRFTEINLIGLLSRTNW